ncbi:MAG TPA: hypothetical protein VFJ58_08500 [Armatimonadota bacterium]|nr:hypothetical protein [Armatimonadota bacterium]
MTASATLSSLLRASLDGLERGCIDEGAGHRPLPSLAGWADLLRASDRAVVDRWVLPQLPRLLKQAVGARISAAVTVESGAGLKTGPGEPGAHG